MRRNVLVACGLALVTVLVTPAVGDPVGDRGPAAGGVVACTEVEVPVALRPGGSRSWTVRGRLCSPGPISGRTVQILVHGGSYDGSYWRPDVSGRRYDFVGAATAAGYGVLVLDRLGVGRSDVPPGEDADVTTAAHSLHDVIQALRVGQVAGVPIARVITVGHSIGSSVVIVEAARYGDVDAVVITSVLHTRREGAGLAMGSVWPAQVDPRFQGRNKPTGYITTRPEMREPVFYYSANADPKVIAHDEATKETFTVAEAAGFFPGLDESPGIRVPVLMVIGDQDRIFCGATPCTDADIAGEAHHYPNAVCYEAVVLPAVGHSLNLHRNAGVWHAAALDWADRLVGPTQDRPATAPCRS